MRLFTIFTALLAIAMTGQAADKPYAFAIHGGAGTITRANLSPALEAEYRAKLDQALKAGEAVLAGDGTALDAVVAAITIMEDSPLFNAGKGAVFTAEGRNELDASIMDGATLNAGAVSSVTRVRSPITLARAVMEASPHVMMSGSGAEQFAREQSLEMVSPLYFHTDRRFRQIMDLYEKDRKETSLDLDADEADRSRGAAFTPMDGLDHKFGTVGAVALDRQGNLAAGTSTGGTTNKLYGRVGDSPIIGAGTYADNASCAVSATGHGEFFIRATVARDICALMEYGSLSLSDAADRIIMDKLVKMGGDGGIIAVDKDGNIALPFNTEGMYRASVREGSDAEIKIYRE